MESGDVLEDILESERGKPGKTGAGRGAGSGVDAGGGRGAGSGVDAGGSQVGPLPGLEAAIDALFASGLSPLSSREAAGAMAEMERLTRRLHAAGVELMNQIDLRGVHRGDGHPTVKVMARHVGKLSNGEALSRAKTMQMLRALPIVKDAFWAGSIGVDQVQLLARVYANPRVRGAMELRQARFVDQASKLDYLMFERRIREWERLIDEDGPEPPNERTHRNRSARLVQDPIDMSWELMGKYAASQGAAMNEIFAHYIEAEYLADWEKARIEHGDNACEADLPRTATQRSADALWQLFQDAAGSDGSAVPPGFVHNIVWDAATFEEMVARMAGEAPQPIDPDTYRCETIDGVPLEPTEAAANAAVSAIRRVVVDAPSARVDLGRKRFFTGAARDAVNMWSSQCVWPGCQVPAGKCEADHLLEHSRGGLTSPGNGAPLCGMHNRWKQKGFSIQRDPAGFWHCHRPDGTEIH